jgi:hypothetical protein
MSIRWLWRTAPVLRAVAAGAVAGFIAGGVGSRLVMYAIRLLNDNRTGATTDSSGTVGEFSVGGTVSLLVLGTLAGILAGLVYLGLRRWLPAPRAWRGPAFGALMLVTVGQALFDPGNVDFQIFEPVLVVVLLFAALFLVNGVILAVLLDRLHPEPAYARSTRVSRAVTGVIAIVAVLGIALFAGTLATMVEDAGTCYSAAGSGEGCAVFVDDIE